MSTSTINYGLIKPTDNEAADITVINGNMDVIDGKLKGIDSGKEPLIKNAVSKAAIVDADVLPLIDSADNSNTKKVSFGKLKDSINEATLSGKGLMSATDKGKLDGIAINANNYIHPTTTGNKHIPSGGTAGQILRNTADGTATWQDLEAVKTILTVTTQNLFGVANVDVALQRIWNEMKGNNDIVTTITTSQTWVPSKDGYIDVFIIGAGGGGGAGGPGTTPNATTSGGNGGTGGGGGGGGYSVLLQNLKVTTGMSFPIVIGTGGAGGTGASAGSTSTSGYDGGNTYFNNIVAKGGKAGTYGASYSNSAYSIGGAGLSGGGAGANHAGGGGNSGGSGTIGSNANFGGAKGVNGSDGISQISPGGTGGQGVISLMDSRVSTSTFGFCPLNGVTYGAGGNGGHSGAGGGGGGSYTGAGANGGIGPTGSGGGVGGTGSTTGHGNPGTTGLSGSGGGGASGYNNGISPSELGGNGGDGAIGSSGVNFGDGGTGGNGGGGGGGRGSGTASASGAGGIGGKGGNGGDGKQGAVIIRYKGVY